MTTVIDVGCARYGGDYSIERLIEMFSPDVLYGFDPAWTDAMMPDTDTQVVVSTAAAWTHDGEVRFMVDGLNGQVGTAPHWPKITCVDLASFIEDLPASPVILKLDAEGAEVELLEHLIETKTDVRLSKVLVEWHPWIDQTRRERIERELACSFEVWPW